MDSETQLQEQQQENNDFDDMIVELYNNLEDYYTNNSEELKQNIIDKFENINSNLQTLISYIKKINTTNSDSKKDDILIILNYFNNLSQDTKTIETFLKIFEDFPKSELTYDTAKIDNFINYRYSSLLKKLYESINTKVLLIGINDILNINKLIAYLEYHILLEKEIEQEENRLEYNEIIIPDLIKKFNENKKK